MSVSQKVSPLFDRTDTNHDGVISRAEFNQMLGSQAVGSPMRSPPALASPMVVQKQQLFPVPCPTPMMAIVVGPQRGANPMPYMPGAGSGVYPSAPQGSVPGLPPRSMSPLPATQPPQRSTSPLPTLTSSMKSYPPAFQNLSLDVSPACSPSHEPELTVTRFPFDSHVASEFPAEMNVEQKIGILDKKERELRQIQLKLVAEQAVNFNRDVEFLKRCMQEIKTKQDSMLMDMTTVRESLGLSHSRHDEHSRLLDALKGPHATADERIKYLESVIGDSGDKHGTLLKSLRDSHDSHRKDLNDIKAVTMHHASFEQRMEYLEKLLGDSADKHAEDLKALQDSHQKHLKDTDDIKAHTIHHASFEQRMEFLEKGLRDSAERHLKELKNFKDSHEKHVQAMSTVHHASLPERMAYVEKPLGDSADKHAKELAPLKAAHDKHASDLAGVKAAHAHYASLQDRVKYIEKVVGDSADKHANEIQALKDAHSKHVVELQGVKAAHGTHIRMEDRIGYLEKHVQELETMKAHCNGCFAKFDKQHGSHAQHASSLQERVDMLEQKIGYTADAHGRELGSLKDAHGRFANAHGQNAQDFDMLKNSHQQTAAQLRDALMRTKDLESAHSNHSKKLESAMAHLANGMPVHDRVKQIEAFLGEHLDKHSKELLALKDAHDQHGMILEGINHRTSDRLDALEKAIAHSTEEKIRMTDEALNTTFKMYEQIRARPSR